MQISFRRDLAPMPHGVCGSCGRHFPNALQLGAHVRTCRQQLRDAGDIIAVPVQERAQITLHSLARRAPSPWGRETRTQQEERRAIACSRYMRDYGPVLPPRVIFLFSAPFVYLVVSLFSFSPSFFPPLLRLCFWLPACLPLCLCCLTAFPLSFFPLFCFPFPPSPQSFCISCRFLQF